MRFPVRAIVPTSLIALAALAVVLVSHQPRADAAPPLVVTKTLDTADGTCSITDCSLREAVIVANADPGADTITLPAATYQFTLGGGWENASAAGDLDITSDVTINGGGAATTILDAGDLDRVLSVFSGTANVFGVTMRNGTGDYGGGVYTAQGATLNLTNVTVSGNTVFGFAAGIYNTGNMTLTNSTVSGNFTGNQTGGVCNCFFSTMTITNSTISGNSAGSIGGLYNFNGGTLTVTGSTISGNTANFIGGINNGSGTMTMTNSTVSGNTSTGTAGGIYTEANTSLTNVTITNNTADSDGDGSGDGGGIYVPWWATANIKNTIIAGNADLSAVTVEPDCHTSTENGGIGLTSQGFNLIQNLAGCTISGDTTGNVTGLSANLSPLADNGGPTWTHALAPGSPAIDAIVEGCPPPATDQRGVTRPKGNDDCDIGSYESPFSGPLPTPTPIPTPTPPPTASPTPTATPTAAPSGTATTTPTPTATAGGPTPTPTTGIPTPTPTPSPTASPGGPLQGDVDCNEKVDSVDSLKVLRYVAGLPVVQNEPCTDIGVGMPGFAAHGGQHLQGDVDCGGDVSSVDALKVLRYVASLALAQSEPCTDIGTRG